MGNTQPKSNPRQGISAPPYDDRRRSEFLTPPVSVQILPRIDLPRTRTLLSAILPKKINDYLQVNISLPHMAHDKTTALAKTTAHTLTSTTATATATANATSEKPSRATRRKTRKDPRAAPTSPTPQSRGMDALAQIDTGCKVGGCDSTGSRVPILPGTDSTGSYRVLLLYTTVRL